MSWQIPSLAYKVYKSGKIGHFILIGLDYGPKVIEIFRDQAEESEENAGDQVGLLLSAKIVNIVPDSAEQISFWYQQHQTDRIQEIISRAFGSSDSQAQKIFTNQEVVSDIVETLDNLPYSEVSGESLDGYYFDCTNTTVVVNISTVPIEGG